MREFEVVSECEMQRNGERYIHSTGTTFHPKPGANAIEDDSRGIYTKQPSTTRRLADSPTVIITGHVNSYVRAYKYSVSSRSAALCIRAKGNSGIKFCGRVRDEETSARLDEVSRVQKHATSEKIANRLEMLRLLVEISPASLG
jgi:hypothetical protein